MERELMPTKRPRLAATAGMLLCMLMACASAVPPPDQRPPADEAMPAALEPELPPGFQLVDRRGPLAHTCRLAHSLFAEQR